MKKHSILILTACLLLNISAYSQLVGGSDDRVLANPSAPKEDQSALYGMFKNRGYFTFSLCKPFGVWSGEQESKSPLLAMQGRDGMAFSGGFSMDFGGMFYLRSLEIHEKAKLAIDWTILDFSLLRSDIMQNDFFVGTRLGPMGTYQVNDNILVDVGFSVSPCLGIAVEYQVFNLMLRKNFNMQVRYKKFLLGFQLDYGNLSEKEIAFSDEFGTGYIDFLTKANFMRFRLGFAI